MTRRSPLSDDAGRARRLAVAHLLLRVGVLGCFVGHGVWGFVPKTAWLPFFDLFSIPQDVALPMMRIIGAVDITVGLLALFYPTRALLAWASLWTVFTALLRPAAGMGMSEFFERAGNYGVPIALLALHAWPSRRSEWFARLLPPEDLAVDTLRRVQWILAVSVATLLAGHGGLALSGHNPLLFDHFSSIGVSISRQQLQLFGLFEIGLGMLVLLRPRTVGLMAFVVVFKLATELLHPVAGSPLGWLETIERMGDYVLPVVLAIVLQMSSSFSRTRSRTGSGFGTGRRSRC